MLVANLALLFSVAFFISAPCHARSLARPGTWDWRDETLLGSHDKRDDAPCVQICSPQLCGGSSCSIGEKRDLDDDVDFFNSTSQGGSEIEQHLFKRQFTTITQGKTATYVREKSLDIGTEALCPESMGGFASPSFCTEHAFSTMPLSNGEGRIEPGARTYWGFQPVLNLIQGIPWTPAAAGNSLTTELFPSGRRPDGRANSYAFIMTPRSRSALNDETSKEFLAEYLMLYNPWRKDKEKPYKGRALFEYDPDADGQSNADWRLWLEHRQITGSSLGLNVDNLAV
ncbi:hypothetical protein G7Z17_g3193 [Cylindrodendrum hubeiense]|uniref:Uncharacterized protein n=1 Tax=Cylindrodendrum hubeiense TaxID=595255 RepID=A0A9P5HGF2_9HYPO|nr:hypothetical protein G7Z17_g3193 [Cylindrodendrum hubeiense]